MVELLHETPDLASITVADVVRRAGVSRPTFYRHFPDLGQLARAAALSRLDGIFARLPEARLGARWESFASQTFRTLFGDLAKEATFYRLALAASGGALEDDIVDYVATRLLDVSPLGPVIRRGDSSVSGRERAEFLAAGIVWHARRWLCSESPEASLDRMVDLVSSLILHGSGATGDEIADAHLA